MRPRTHSVFTRLVALTAILLTSQLAFAADVVITVKDKDKGTPIADATVTFRLNKSKTQTFKTGPDGTVKVKLADKFAGRVTATAVAPGLVTATQILQFATPEERPKGFDFSLVQALTFGGIVTDTNGKPIAGAHVELGAIVKTVDGVHRLWDSQKLITDADGKWSAPNMSPEITNCYITVWDYMHIPSGEFSQEKGVEKLDDLKAGTYTTQLPADVSPITIHVTDDKGLHVPKSEVILSRHQQGSALPNLTPDANGEVKVAMERGAMAIFTAVADGYAAEQTPVTVGASPVDAKIILKDGDPISGQVLDAFGIPAKKAQISIADWRGTRPMMKTVHTNAAGEFTIPFAPADEVTLEINAPGSETLSVKIKPGEHRVISLNIPTTVDGTVVDAETGKPIEKFQVEQGYGYDNNPEMYFMSYDRLKSTGPGKFEHTITEVFPRLSIRVLADGYLASDSPVFKSDNVAHPFTFKMKKAQGVTGTIVDTTGAPVADASVVAITKGEYGGFQNGRLYADRNDSVIKADPQGHFTLYPQDPKFTLHAASSKGYAQLTSDDFAKSPTITLQSLGKVEGVALLNTHPAANETIMINSQLTRTNDDRFNFNGNAQTDSKGHFTFDSVLPGPASVARNFRIGNMGMSVDSANIVVKPGETTTIQLGGIGRPVIGRLTLSDAINSRSFGSFNSQLSTNSRIHSFPHPAEAVALPAEEKSAWLKTWLATDEGKKAVEAEQKENQQDRKFFQVFVHQDGTFRVDNVPPGNYDLTIHLNAVTADGGWNNDVLASVHTHLVVPAIPTPASEDAYDVGTLTPTSLADLKPGDTAPDFTATTMDGKPFTLSQLHGKYVMLQFWTTWFGPTKKQLEALHQAWKTYGSGDKLVMVGINGDEDPRDTKIYMTAQHLDWPQITQDPRKSTIRETYNIRADNAVWLIDTQGKIIARDVIGDDFQKTLADNVK